MASCVVLAGSFSTAREQLIVPASATVYGVRAAEMSPPAIMPPP
jgi:hypothetical protein